MPKFRKIPIVIEAFKWTGGSTAPVDLRLGKNWGRADVYGVPWNFEKDKEELVIFNSMEQAWIPCPVGHWIIQGVKGEFYPCEPDVFEQTYEPVSAGR